MSDDERVRLRDCVTAQPSSCNVMGLRTSERRRSRDGR